MCFGRQSDCGRRVSQAITVKNGMDFSQVPIPPEFILQRPGVAPNATLSGIANNRKRSHEPTNDGNSAVQIIKYDTCLASHDRSEEPPVAQAIKQRFISIPPGSAEESADLLDPARPFSLSPKQLQDAVSEARLVATIELFPPFMHGQLQTFRDNQNFKTTLACASVLIETLSARNIKLSQRRKSPLTPTLFNLLNKCELNRDHQLITNYFRKARVFFAAVDTLKIKNTGCLSSMLQHKSHARAFIDKSDGEIQRIATSPRLKRLAGAFAGKGMPDLDSLAVPVTGAPKLVTTADSAQEDILSKFHPSQRELLRKSPREYSRTLLNDANILIRTLNQRGIPLTHVKHPNSPALLLELIKRLDPVKDCQLISTFLRKAVVFFTNIDPSRIKSTRYLCDMLQHKVHIELFAAMKDADIAAVARHPLLKPISQHFRNNGLPDPELIRHITQPTEIKRVLATQTQALATPARSDFELEAVIGHFTPHQQEVLRQYQHIESIQVLLRNAAKMINTLKKRGMKLVLNRSLPQTPMLFASLKAFSVIDDYQLMADYFNKADVFFSAVDTGEIRDTHCLSSMLKHKVQIRTLVETSDDDIRKLARSPRQRQRQLGSANFTKGLPDLNHISDFAGLELFHGQDGMPFLVTSMCYGQRTPNADEVRVFVQRLCGQEQSVIYAIASMCMGRGIPDASLLDGFLTLKFAQKEEALRMLTTVCRARGIPPANDVNNLLQWLPAGQTTTCMNLLSQLFTSAGIPEVSALIEQEKVLETIFCNKQPPEASLSLQDRFKPLALFCLNPNKWHLNKEEFKDFLDADHFPSRHSALDAVQNIVLNLGGQGVRLWLEKHRNNFQDMSAVTRALLLPAPFEIVNHALSKLPASQWHTYIELCKDLSPLPSQTQWETLVALLQKVDVNFPLATVQKRMLLEILWSQSDCWLYASHIDRLLMTVPAVEQLHQVHRQLSIREMKAFLDACLIWRPVKNKPPGLSVIESLLEGLLAAHYPLDCPGEIPGLCFSSISEDATNKRVTIDGESVMTGNERLWHFVTAMLMELNRVGYDYSHKRLSIKPHSDDNICLPKPKFTLTDSGFVITNWSLLLLDAFFLATDFAEYNNRPNICKKLALEHRERTIAANNQAAAAQVVAPRAAAVEESQAADNVPVISEPDIAAKIPWGATSDDPGHHIEFPDFSWLEREFDFPEDCAKSEPDALSIEQLMTFLEHKPNTTLPPQEK